MHLLFSLSEINTTAQALLAQMGSKKVLALQGNMGAGKTTFIAALCKALGVLEKTSSPTYPIINQYLTQAGGTIYHMDWYRLKNEQEAIQAGVEEPLYSGNICFVEWPNVAAELLPNNTWHITIEATHHHERKIVF